MSPEQFVGDFVAHARADAANLRDFGAADQARAVERVAQDLEERFRGWWLEELTVSQAAGESRYSEERLREMAREGTLPHKKGEGSRGHLTIARCNLPQRPRHKDNHTSLEERLLRPN